MIKIKNWNKLQHFKDRSPPWIKLYKDILNQRDIMMISDCNFRILIGLWLLASEDESREGILPEIADISFRLRKTEEEIINSFQELKDFLIYDDINVISNEYQDCILETETETETEKRQKKKTSKKIMSLSEIENHPLSDHYQKWFENECRDVDRFKLRDKLVRYCRSKGKTYKDYWSTLQNWAIREQEEINNKKPKSQAIGMRAWEEAGLV